MTNRTTAKGMKVYKVERTITIKIEEEVVARSKREALEIADEVISFPTSEGYEYSTDKVVAVGRTITEDDPKWRECGGYLGWEDVEARNKGIFKHLQIS
jgi:hypothetical protein